MNVLYVGMKRMRMGSALKATHAITAHTYASPVDMDIVTTVVKFQIPQISYKIFRPFHRKEFPNDYYPN